MAIKEVVTSEIGIVVAMIEVGVEAVGVHEVVVLLVPLVAKNVTVTGSVRIVVIRILHGEMNATDVKPPKVILVALTADQVEDLEEAAVVAVAAAVGLMETEMVVEVVVVIEVAVKDSVEVAVEVEISAVVVLNVAGKCFISALFQCKS